MRKTIERFYSYYAQKILIELLKGPKSITDLSHLFQGTFANIYNTVIYLESKKLLSTNKVKVERIINLTNKGKIIATKLNEAITEFEKNG